MRPGIQQTRQIRRFSAVFVLGSCLFIALPAAAEVTPEAVHELCREVMDEEPEDRRTAIQAFYEEHRADLTPGQIEALVTCGASSGWLGSLTDPDLAAQGRFRDCLIADYLERHLQRLSLDGFTRLLGLARFRYSTHNLLLVDYAENHQPPLSPGARERLARLVRFVPYWLRIVDQRGDGAHDSGGKLTAQRLRGSLPGNP